MHSIANKVRFPRLSGAGAPNSHEKGGEYGESVHLLRECPDLILRRRLERIHEHDRSEPRSLRSGRQIDGLPAPRNGAVSVQFDRLAVGVITAANSPERATRGESRGFKSRRDQTVPSGPSRAAVWSADPIGEVAGSNPARLAGSSVRSERPTLFPSRSLTSSQAAVKPEADTLLPSVSGAYSPWAIRRSSNSLRSIYP